MLQVTYILNTRLTSKLNLEHIFFLVLKRMKKPLNALQRLDELYQIWFRTFRKLLPSPRTSQTWNIKRSADLLWDFIENLCCPEIITPCNIIIRSKPIETQQNFDPRFLSHYRIYMKIKLCYHKMYSIMQRVHAACLPKDLIIRSLPSKCLNPKNAKYIRTHDPFIHHIFSRICFPF